MSKRGNAPITNNVMSMCGGVSCGLISNSYINIDNKNNTNILLNKIITDNFVWEEPGSAKALGFFTGLFLLIPSPITIPLGLSIENDELGKQVSESNDRIASKISQIIIDTARSGATISQPKEQITNKLERLKELFNKGLISKDEYEIKQKEILNTFLFFQRTNLSPIGHSGQWGFFLSPMFQRKEVKPQMTHAEIVSRLSRLIDSPTSDVLYSITMQQVLTAIAYRMGDDALSLSSADLQLALDEVQAAINHSLDYRPYVDEGLDAWEITRHL